MMSRLRLLVMGVGGVAVATACHSSTAPTPNGSASVTLTAAEATRVGDEIRISVEISTRNLGGTTLKFSGCGIWIERAVDDEWRYVWDQLCLQDAYLELPPSEERKDSITIRLQRQPGQSPWVYGPIEGTYRVVRLIEDQNGISLPIDERASASFELREPD